MKALWLLFFCLSANFFAAAQQSDFAVEVGAFAEKVPLSYFKIAGAYESVDQNQIYRYYIDAPSKQDAEALRQKAITAGHINARVVDFNYIREQCDAACGYTPRQRTSDKTSVGETPINTGNPDLNPKKNPLRITGVDLYVYWSNELKKRGITMDSASLFAFWKNNREQIGVDLETWFKLFEKELAANSTAGTTKKNPLKISRADMYIFWSSEVKKKGVPMTTSGLTDFWEANKETIGMTKEEWLKLFEQELAKNPTVTEVLTPTNLKTDEKVQCIFFDFGSPSLRDISKNELDKLSKILHNEPSWRLEIAAHADGKGSAESNKKLSLRRANSARKYLVYKGLNSKRIVLTYYGKDRPIARNEFGDKSDCEAGRQLNRRVEFYVFNANGNKMDIVLPIIVPENLRY